MIQAQSYLNVADNSGARKIMCIRVLIGSRRKYAKIGDTIIGVVKASHRICQLKNRTLFEPLLFVPVKQYDAIVACYFDLTITPPLLLIKMGTHVEHVFLDLLPVSYGTKF